MHAPTLFKVELAWGEKTLGFPLKQLLNLDERQLGFSFVFKRPVVNAHSNHLDFDMLLLEEKGWRREKPKQGENKKGQNAAVIYGVSFLSSILPYPSSRDIQISFL